MKTKAVRMYGTRDLRLEEFELPQIKEDEILVKVMSDSICMSTYKLVEQGKKHKRYKEKRNKSFHLAPPFARRFLRSPTEPAKLTIRRIARIVATMIAQSAYMLNLTLCTVWL